MKPARAIIAIVIAGAIAGCSVYGGAPVYGDFHRVSSADLHAALVAVRKERQVPDAYAFRVVSANEIWIYFTDQGGDAYIATRNNGRWKFAGVHVSPKDQPLLFDPNPNT